MVSPPATKSFAGGLPALSRIETGRKRKDCYSPEKRLMKRTILAIAISRRRRIFMKSFYPSRQGM